MGARSKTSRDSSRRTGESGAPAPETSDVRTITGLLVFTAEYNPIAFVIRPPEDWQVLRLISRWELAENTSGSTYRVQAINASGGSISLRGASQVDPDTYNETILPMDGVTVEPFMPLAAGEELLLNIAPNGFDPGITGRWYYIVEYQEA